MTDCFVEGAMQVEPGRQQEDACNYPNRVTKPEDPGMLRSGRWPIWEGKVRRILSLPASMAT